MTGVLIIMDKSTEGRWPCDETEAGKMPHEEGKDRSDVPTSQSMARIDRGPETRSGKEQISPSEPPKVNLLCQHLDLGLLGCITMRQ